MKNAIPMVLLAFGVSACQMATAPVQTAAASEKQLATAGDMSAITGKTLTLEPGKSLTLTKDGKMRGSWEGSVLLGTYEMRDGYFCRTLSAGPYGGAPEDCQLMVLRGNTLEVTRDRGNGEAFTYTIS